MKADYDLLREKYETINVEEVINDIDSSDLLVIFHELATQDKTISEAFEIVKDFEPESDDIDVVSTIVAIRKVLETYKDISLNILLEAPIRNAWSGKYQKNTWGNRLANVFKRGASAIKRGAVAAGKWGAKAAVGGAKVAGNATKVVGRGIGNVAKATGNVAGSVAKGIGQGIGAVAKGIGQGFDSATAGGHHRGHNYYDYNTPSSRRVGVNLSGYNNQPKQVSLQGLQTQFGLNQDEINKLEQGGSIILFDAAGNAIQCYGFKNGNLTVIKAPQQNIPPHVPSSLKPQTAKPTAVPASPSATTVPNAAAGAGGTPIPESFKKATSKVLASFK